MNQTTCGLIYDDTVEESLVSRARQKGQWY